MRTSEWINLSFLAFFALIAMLRPLSLRRRSEAIGIGLAGIIVTLAGICFSRLPLFGGSAARDLLPAPIMLFVYWQAGRFYRMPNEWIQRELLLLDEKFIGRILRLQANRGTRSWLLRYLEFAYLSCYPLVPLGVGVLYAFEKQERVDKYWVIVLLSTYLCYILLPFIQMLPPRMLTSENELMPHSDSLRVLNLSILKRASIQVNTFPSAHVASTTAAALALLRFVPEAGVVFLVISLSIAGGAVLGRYHYAADAVLGVLLSLVVFLLVK
jgi:hypothetical protein